MDTKGFVHVAQNPEHTTYHWGPISEIAGARLKVVDTSTDAPAGEGDFLCVNAKGLIDVDRRDVTRFVPMAQVNPLFAMIENILGGKRQPGT